MKKNLYKWWVRQYYTDPYRAPEDNFTCLGGFIEGKDLPIKTSKIVEVNGIEVTTKSGSVYILCDINVDYYQYLKDNNIKYDTSNPITIKDFKKN
jgi:hypothetical protein